MCARFGRGSAVMVCARRCTCRLDLANIHRHAHHSSRRRWSCGATWSDMKRTCATCHEYSWHAPFVSSNSMVVVTNGGHSCSGRHSSPRAPFCTVLGADWGWRLECSSRVRARCRAEAGMRLYYLVQFRGRGDKPWPFCAWLPFSFLRTALPFSLSCPALQQVRASCH